MDPNLNSDKFCTYPITLKEGKNFMTHAKDYSMKVLGWFIVHLGTKIRYRCSIGCFHLKIKKATKGGRNIVYHSDLHGFQGGMVDNPFLINSHSSDIG